MKSLHNAILSAWLISAAALANPCALGPYQDGIGGTGRSPDVPGESALGGGIGGTGYAPVGQGMGGTGTPAGAGELARTGLVGVVTGFASICVNGVEVHYDDSTPVTLNGNAANVSSLQVGQLVAVAAQPGKLGLHAHQIAIQYAVSGLISRVNPGGNSIEILGQRVEFGAGAIRDASGRPLSPRELQPGVPVRVSGLRSPAGHIVASLVERPAKPVQPQVHGLAETAPDATVRVGGMRLQVAPHLSRPSGPIIADLSPDGRTILSYRAQAALQNVDRMMLQGIVREQSADQIRLDTSPPIQLDGAQRQLRQDVLQPGRLLAITARRDAQGVWRAERLEPLEADALMRRAGRETPSSGAQSDGKSSGNHRHRNGDDRDTSSRDDDATRSENSGKGSTDDRRVRTDDRLSTSGRIETIDKVTARPEKQEKIEKIEKPDKIEKPEKIDRPDRSGRSRD